MLSPFLKSSVTLERIGRVGRAGFGLFGLREGRLFVPHGQKLAKEVGASSTSHAFSERGYNYHRTLWWGDNGYNELICQEGTSVWWGKKASDARVGREAGKMNAVTTIVEMNGLVRRGRWQEPRV